MCPNRWLPPLMRSEDASLMRSLLIFLTSAGMAIPATAAPFEDATEQMIGVTGDWTNKVELADIDGDGLVDILFANGGNYASPGTPQLNGAFLNRPDGSFEDVSEAVFQTADLTRVIKAHDLNQDGVVDLVIGTTYQTQSRLLLGLGDGAFVEVTDTHLPAASRSVGDIAVGDVDGDGDLDLVVADWGAGNPLNNEGGRTRLWLNNGFGAFTDATEDQMPDVLVRFSWELELVDVDNDWDLDILVSCKSCGGSKLFQNDGEGSFADTSELLPQYSNNYDIEAMDLNGDGFLDLITINDGPGLREHVFLADGAGGFTDATESLWPNAANIGEDDNMVAFLDYDSDGDADFLVGSLSGEDRLLLNDGSGALSLQTSMFSGATTPGTLGIALADLNGDARLDVVHAQGEVASAEKVFLGVDIAPDAAGPTIGIQRIITLDDGTIRVDARVHDRKTPVMPHDFQTVHVKWSVNSGDIQSTPMRWTGELFFRMDMPPPLTGVMSWQVCATDRAGNSACGPLTSLDVAGDGPTPEPDTEPTEPDTNPPAADESPRPAEDAESTPAEDSGEAVADSEAGSIDTKAPTSGAENAGASGSTQTGGCTVARSHRGTHSFGFIYLWVFAAYGLRRFRGTHPRSPNFLDPHC